MKKTLIIIAGPTGVGKTKWAIDLAKKNDAEIFSADSRQIYKEMSIGTAKPTLKEMDGIKHHFVDYLSIHHPFSVGDYERAMSLSLEEYFQSKNVAILCGGTGLYIDAVINGIDVFPDISKDTAERTLHDLEQKGLPYLVEELLASDPNYHAKVDLHNSRRVTRAINVIRQSGKPYSSFLNQPKPPKNFTIEPYVLIRDRKVLYQRINNRVDQMVKDGLIEEARSLFIHRQLKSLSTVGYQELFAHFEGEITIERAIKLIKQNSRRYAKRQLTWFRKRSDWTTIDLDKEEA